MSGPPHPGFEAFGRGGGTAPQDWGTPWDLFRRWDARFRFNLDPCANPQNTKVPGHYFTPEQDGLRQDWGGAGTVAFTNPPYGSDTTRWMAKAIEEVRKGAVVVFLVFVRCDTRWWHRYVPLAAEVHLLKGRVQFVRPGENAAAAPMPSCIVVFTPESVTRGKGPVLFHGSARGAPNEVIPNGDEEEA